MPLNWRNIPVVFCAVLALVAMPQCANAQKKGPKTENLPNFDQRAFHFGFLLSYNTSDFFVDLKPTSLFADSLTSLQHIKAPGFDLGIVASLNFNPNWSVRFIPSLSFQDRILRYRFRQADGSFKQFDKPVESTYLQFPLLLKFRSDRIRNFAVYALAGGKYSLDMASQQDVNNEIDDDVVIKLKKADYSAEIGGGVDFFLLYFKFGLELKMGIGIPNLLIDDGTKFSTPVNSLRSKTYVFTLTFEG